MRFNWRCHAYCQMTNHYHLVVETVEDGNLSRGMRQLNGVYTQWVNSCYRRVGHLFQGRYHAVLVDKTAHLLELSRYVVLNPVRAGMVPEVGDWPWSSYQAMVGSREADEFLETDWLLSQFASTRQVAIRGYVDFVRDGLADSGPGVWRHLKGRLFLGDERFVQQIIDRQPLENDLGGDLREVPAMERRAFTPLEAYLDRGDRRRAMAEAYLSGHHTMRQIADRFGVHYATVSRAVKQYGSGMISYYD